MNCSLKKPYSAPIREYLETGLDSWARLVVQLVRRPNELERILNWWRGGSNEPVSKKAPGVWGQKHAAACLEALRRAVK